MQKCVVTITLLTDEKGTDINVHIKGTTNSMDLSRAVVMFGAAVKDLMAVKGLIENFTSSGRIQSEA